MVDSAVKEASRIVKRDAGWKDMVGSQTQEEEWDVDNQQQNTEKSQKDKTEYEYEVIKIWFI